MRPHVRAALFESGLFEKCDLSDISKTDLQTLPLCLQHVRVEHKERGDDVKIFRRICERRQAEIDHIPEPLSKSWSELSVVNSSSDCISVPGTLFYGHFGGPNMALNFFRTLSGRVTHSKVGLPKVRNKFSKVNTPLASCKKLNYVRDDRVPVPKSSVSQACPRLDQTRS